MVFQKPKQMYLVLIAVIKMETTQIMACLAYSFIFRALDTNGLSTATESSEEPSY